MTDWTQMSGHACTAGSSMLGTLGMWTSMTAAMTVPSLIHMLWRRVRRRLTGQLLRGQRVARPYRLGVGA